MYWQYERSRLFIVTSITVIHTRLSLIGKVRLPRPQYRETNAQFIIDKGFFISDTKRMRIPHIPILIFPAI